MNSEVKMAQRDGQMLACPKCRESLLVALSDGQEVDYCRQCKGVWVDFASESTVLKIPVKTFTLDELNRLRMIYQPPAKADPVRYVPCPVCQELMNRRIWGSHSGVVVDKCFKHGTWYDDGELAKIQEYVALGGVEYEKVFRTENDLNLLDQKLIREIGRLDKSMSSHYSRARIYSMIGF